MVGTTEYYKALRFTNTEHRAMSQQLRPLWSHHGVLIYSFLISPAYPIMWLDHIFKKEVERLDT